MKARARLTVLLITLALWVVPARAENLAQCQKKCQKMIDMCIEMCSKNAKHPKAKQSCTTNCKKMEKSCVQQCTK